MFKVRERSMSDTPIEGCMNSDSLGCAVSFVLSVGSLLLMNISAEASSILYARK